MPIAAPEIWLERLVAAEEAGLQRGADRWSFALEHTGGMQRHIDHPGWDPSWAVPTEQDIDDLLDRGWVRLDSPASGKRRLFTLTPAGRIRGQRALRERAGAQSLPVSLEWTTLEPALDAAISAYEQAGAPDGGIQTRTVLLPDGVPRAALAELTRAGLLIDCEVESGGTSGVDQVSGPGLVRPSTEALRIRRGWPRDAADAAIERLVTALLEQADATDDEDEKTRLRKTAEWLGRVGTNVLTNVGTQLAGGEAGRLLH